MGKSLITINTARAVELAISLHASVVVLAYSVENEAAIALSFPSSPPI